MEIEDPIPALKEQIADALRELIDPVCQGVAAGVLGIEQPRISDIAHGRLGRLSLQRLIRLLVRGGRTVTITVTNEGPKHFVLPTGPALARERRLRAASFDAPRAATRTPPAHSRCPAPADPPSSASRSA